jgi:bifunctional UDP-N-acetylglucosamine pyrophosphorylase/glucosamine-1-phosphate N-acetyltransferase
LEENISMGSGSVLANLRLDEQGIYSHIKGERLMTDKNKLGAIIGKNVRIGVNTSVMPGVKIGPDSMIGAGLTISQDIPESSFVTGKTELTIEKNKKQVGSDREQFKSKL